MIVARLFEGWNELHRVCVQSAIRFLFPLHINLVLVVLIDKFAPFVGVVIAAVIAVIDPMLLPLVIIPLLTVPVTII